jgi:hypothetical protein
LASTSGWTLLPKTRPTGTPNVRLLSRIEESPDLHTEGACQLDQREDGHVVAALDTPDLPSIDLHLVGKNLLGPPPRLAQLDHALPEVPADSLAVVHPEKSRILLSKETGVRSPVPSSGGDDMADVTKAGMFVTCVLVVVGCGRGSKPKIDLGSATADGPSAAELAPIFELGGKATDLQRDEKEKEITGKVVEWAGLKVYDVKKHGDACFRIQTSSTGSAPGTFINACPDDDATKTLITAFKTGDRLDVKGQIHDVSMRNIDIDPAIVSAHAGASASDPAPTPSPPGATSGTPSKKQAAPSAPEAPVFAIGKVVGKMKSGFGRHKGTYLGVDFQVTAKTKPENGTVVTVKASCKVADELMVDTSPDLGLGADKLGPGETKKGDVSFWVLAPLEKVPASCTLSFGSGEGFHDAEMNLGDFCFTPPSAVAPGVCPQ